MNRWWFISIAIIVEIILYSLFIKVFKKQKIGQSIRKEGPKSHINKKGTPTMGGLFMIGALVVTSLIVAGVSKDILVLVLATIGFGAIGFIDDFIKVVLKRNLGLLAKQKFLMQIMRTCLKLMV